MASSFSFVSSRSVPRVGPVSGVPSWFPSPAVPPAPVAVLPAPVAVSPRPGGGLSSPLAFSLRPWSSVGAPGVSGPLLFAACSCWACSSSPAAGWCASRRTLLVSVGGGAPVECRTAGVPPAEVSRLVAELRAAAASGVPVSLVAHGSWSPARFFCGVVPRG